MKKYLVLSLFFLCGSAKASTYSCYAPLLADGPAYTMVFDDESRDLKSVETTVYIDGTVVAQYSYENIWRVPSVAPLGKYITSSKDESTLIWDLQKFKGGSERIIEGDMVEVSSHTLNSYNLIECINYDIPERGGQAKSQGIWFWHGGGTFDDEIRGRSYRRIHIH